MAERRRWRRVALPIEGRVMLPNGAEAACSLIDVSAGGVRARAAAPLRPGVRLVFHFPALGRLDATVTRVDEAGFSAALNATLRKRDRLADAIAWEHNRSKLNLEEDRTGRRETRTGRIAIELTDGVRFHAELIDLSEMGASFESLERPKLGELALVNGAPARVVRLHERGFAVRFNARPAPVDADERGDAESARQ